MMTQESKTQIPPAANSRGKRPMPENLPADPNDDFDRFTARVRTLARGILAARAPRLFAALASALHDANETK